MKLTRFCDLETRDIDKKQGIVSFYFATFGTKNGHNERILDADPFKKTIEENRKRIKHFKNHNEETPLGVIKEIGHDMTGMFVVSQIAQTQRGIDTVIEYDAGLITEHSYGFNAIKEDNETEPGTRILKEVRLWEVSTLTGWGSDEFTAMKELRGANSVEKVIDTIESIENILHRTSISDEGAKILEHKLRNLNELITSLNERKQPGETTESKDEPIADTFSFNLQEFKNKLNK